MAEVEDEVNNNEEGEKRPSFRNPQIIDNKDGWGPVGIPEHFRNLPFTTFNKGDKIGKVADWNNLVYSARGMNARYTQQYSATQPGTGQFGYFHDDEGDPFQLVDSSRPQKSQMQRANRMKQQQYNRRLVQKEKERRIQAGYYPAPTKTTKGLTKERQRQLKWAKNRGWGNRRPWGDQRNQQSKTRQPSVQARPEWEVLEEMDFPRLAKLHLPNIHEGQDIKGERYGTLEMYDKTYDRVNTRFERPLQRTMRKYFNITASEDPVIQKLAKSGAGRIFATDSVLAALMCCTRSVYSWDVIATKIGNKLFLDKRDSSPIDFLTVSETATEPPSEEGNSINSPKYLSLEATFINANFSQQVLKKGTDDVHSFENRSIPFLEPGQDPKEVASVAYRYRTWNLNPDGEPLILVSRTEQDGFTVNTQGQKEYITIKAFNEWDSKLCGGVDWRQKLDSQKGAVVATELKNNSCKLAKWTVQALLAASDQIKFGYVSRVHARDSSKHVILSMQQFRPTEFAHNITLNMDNCWGILRVIIDKCMEQPEQHGKFLLMKDPNKPMIRMYKIPVDTFEEESDEEDDDEEEDEDEAESKDKGGN